MFGFNFDYATVRAQLIEAMLAKASWKETAVASTGVMFIELAAQAVDMLGYGLEQLAKEQTVQYAQLRSSLFHQAKRVGYAPARKASARCTLVFTLEADWWDTHADAVVLPRHTQVSSADGKTFLTAEEKMISAPSLTTSVEALEGSAAETTQAADGSVWQAVQIPLAGQDVEAVENSSLRVTVGDDEWDEADTFATLAADDESFVAERMLAAMEIQFGDGVHGAIPAEGLDIVAGWIVSSGAAGNLYATDVLTSIDDTVYDAGGAEVDGLSVTNSTAATGGTDEESKDEIRANYPRNVGASYGVGTREDYQAKLLAYPGVEKAMVWGESEALGGEESNPDMAWTVKAVLMPVGGGEFGEEQKAAIQEYIDDRKALGCRFVIEDPVYNYIDFVVSAMRTAAAETTTVQAGVEEALSGLFDDDEVNFGQELRESDVGAALDALDGLDYHETEMFLAESDADHPAWVGNGTTIAFSGTLSAAPVAPGTVKVCVQTASGAVTEKARDDGIPVGGLGSFSGAATGTVNYYTGAVSFVLASAPASGEKVRVRYRPALEARVTLGTGDGSAMSFSGFMSAAICPSTAHVYVAGTAEDADDGFGAWGEAGGSLDYASGYVSVTLAEAPAEGEDVEVLASVRSDDLDLPYDHMPQEGEHNITVESP